MSVSISSAKTAASDAGNSSSSKPVVKKSLSQLIRFRDAKRAMLQGLFMEKKKIMERMKEIEDECLEIDEEIEVLEDERERRRLSRTLSNQPQSPQVKSEPQIKSEPQHQSPIPLMTANPDEVLTEPTQWSPTRDNHDDNEQLTDPLTWTQVERSNETATTSFVSSPNLPQHRKQQQQQQQQKRVSSRRDDDDDADDCYYDSADDDMPKPEEHETRNQKKNPSGKIPSLEFEAVSGPKPSNARNSTGILDSFLIPSRNNPNNSSSGRNPQHQDYTPTTHFSTPSFPLPPSSSSSCPYSSHDIHQTLRQSFRLQTFRENQFEIIQATLSGKDTFVLMKTGGGKSLLYQLPAVLERPKVTIVVSPLLSLIQDQEDQMNGFLRNSCVSFTSGMGTSQHNENWRRVRDVHGGIVMILVTPERVFKSNKLRSELQNLNEQNRLGRFVIDECHCACQWGHDFRPDYGKLQVLRNHFPHIPIMAVTATASENVRQDCVQIFQLSRDHAFFRSTANRPNLAYQVRPKKADIIEDMAEFIKTKHPQSAGIVYAYSRKDADTIAFELCELGIIAESYHSDVSPTRKRAIHQSWMANRTQVVVATIAFGLGINKPDVRFVLHHTLSKTLESYYQESGRAGRDGNPSDCVLYYSPKDVIRMLAMISDESNEDLFTAMVRYAQQFGDDQACRALILQQMGEPNIDLKKFCRVNDKVEVRDVTPHAKTLMKLLMQCESKRMTMNMLVTEWRKTPSTALACVKDNPPGKDLTKEDCEQVIVGLMMNRCIEPKYRFTAYSTIVYLECTNEGRRFTVTVSAKMKLPLPKRVATKRKTKQNTPVADEDGWVDTKPAAKRKRTSSASASSSKSKVGKKKKAPTKKVVSKKSTSTKTKTSKKGPSTKQTKPRAQKLEKNKENEVIELIEDSDDEFVSSTKNATRPRRAAATASAAATRSIQTNRDPWDDDSVSEFEFE